MRIMADRERITFEDPQGNKLVYEEQKEGAPIIFLKDKSGDQVCFKEGEFLAFARKFQAVSEKMRQGRARLREVTGPGGMPIMLTPGITD